ncbi:MAG: glycosyltransferase family 1 protein [Microlunatus sp.]|nr:glycosyltransferase family 1 protein [Microlunatus sp.]
MKIAIVAESFLPSINGVTHSVLQLLDYLSARGHRPTVIAAADHDATDSYHPAAGPDVPVHRLPALAMPGYTSFRVAVGGSARLCRLLTEIDPDVVHLASPFVLGWRAIVAADRLRLPTVAVYQTEVPAYAARYGIPAAEPMLWRRVVDIHDRATLTLAPSSFSCAELESRGVPRVRRWGRGVDGRRFHPRHRDQAWRREVAPDGEVIIGYVGRLAAEKQVDDLAVLADLPNTRLVITGDGPYADRLRSLLPTAVFTGFLGGHDLARLMAGLDVFVHPGEAETFCQTIQEAMASGVPVVAVGRGGPLDLVDHSRTGWLYRPGDLESLRARVADLAGDTRKRLVFGETARRRVENSSWAAVCDELMAHYRDAVLENQRGVTRRSALRRLRDRNRGGLAR